MGQETIIKLSIIIPVFNESRFIFDCLTKVAKADSLGLKKEIIVIDDGSTDASLSKVFDFIKQIKLKLVYQKANLDKYTGVVDLLLIKLPTNKGKGKAVRTGITKSSGDVVIIQDADLEYDPADYQNLLAPFIHNQADVVYGSRFIASQPHRVLYYWHYLGNKVITHLVNLTTNLNLTDVECGYKVFKGKLIRQLAKKLSCNDFGFEIEVSLKLARLKKLKIYEVGITYWGRTYAEGKKITWRDGLKAIWLIAKYSFVKY